MSLSLVTDTGSYHYMCICNQPPTLCRHQLVHTQPPAPHNCCLPLYKVSGPRDTTKDPNSPCCHCRYPAMLTKNHTVVNPVDSCGLTQRDFMPLPLPWTQSCHMPLHLAVCDTRYRVTTHSHAPKIFHYQSQSIKSARSDHFFSSANTYTRIPESQLGNHGHHQRNISNFQ